MSTAGALLLTLSARQSQASALRVLAGVAAQQWVVVVRELPDREQPCLYAYLASELNERLGQRPQAGHESLEAVLELHEWAASAVADDTGRVFSEAMDGRAEAPSRCVVVDEALRPVDVMEALAVPAVVAAAAGGIVGDLSRPSRGGTKPTRSTLPAAPRVKGGKPEGRDKSERGVGVWLHGKAPRTLRTDADDVVEVIVARNGPVLPGVPGLGAVVNKNKKITVLLSVLGDAVQLVGPAMQTLDVPAGDKKSYASFEIHALQAGMVELALVFRQEGQELGQLHLVLHVAADAPPLPRSVVQVPAQMPAQVQAGASADAPILWLDVEPQVAGAERRYRYRVTSDALGLDHKEFNSPVLLDSQGDPAASELAFIQRLYTRLSNKVFRSAQSARQFDDELKATAEDLCQQLLPPDLLDLLWQARGRIGTIRLMSWEPHVPWELLRLHQPGGASDERFLGDYGLVRWLSGRSAVRELALADWSFLAATYPNNPVDDVVQDVAYFTQTLPQRHILPMQIPATYDALTEALQKPAYDVLHLACHGEATHESIDEATLFITDEVEAGGRVRPVGMSANVLGRIARLEARRPLVFLNACSAGRLGMSLTAWGGWPKKLIDQGAGAVVGASWPVRDKVSNTFATAFYEALLDGQPLAQASTAARSAATTSGDATCLAFKVFGDPNARRRVVSKP